MNRLGSKRSMCIAGGLSGVCGVVLLGLSFAINNDPAPGATSAELANFAQQNYAKILWGAWMQAVGPVLIVLFAFLLVHLAGATQQLAGWMTFFGATILMTVSLIEITFYMSALYREPAVMPSISLNLISAVQHLYFIVAAPALFLPLGIVLVRSRILPKLFGYLALLLAATFATLGIIFRPNLREVLGSDYDHFMSLVDKAVLGYSDDMVQFNPKMSYALPEWIKADPNFWAPKPGVIRASTTGGEANKTAVVPAAMKDAKTK